MIFKSWDLPTTLSLAAGKIANKIDETCKVSNHLFIKLVTRFALFSPAYYTHRAITLIQTGKRGRSSGRAAIYRREI